MIQSIYFYLPTAHSSLHSSLRDAPQFIRRTHSLYERKIEAFSRGTNTTETSAGKTKKDALSITYTLMKNKNKDRKTGRRIFCFERSYNFLAFCWSIFYVNYFF